MDKVLQVAKAIVGAAAGAGMTAWVSASNDGVVTTQEWEQIVGAAVVIGFLTWLTPNKKPAS